LSAHRLLRRRKQQQPQNSEQQQRQQLKERAQERARDAVVPLLARAVASAEAAQRAASQHSAARGCAAHGREKCLRVAREASAAAADREAAMEQRGQLAAVQSELRSLLAVAAALVEEEREREPRRGWVASHCTLERNC
jgi:hypothetical protein